MVAKKTAAKKSSPKKTAAKKVASEKKSSSRSQAAKKAAATRKKNAEAAKQEAVQEAADAPPGRVLGSRSEVTRIAEEASVKGSRWGSGRERDEMVKAAGHDPAEVRAEMHRLRVEGLSTDAG